MKLFYFWPLILAALLAIIVTPLVKKIAVKFNIVDRPGQRKIHHHPVPLLGGLSIFLAFSLTTGVFLLLGYILDNKINQGQTLAIIFGGLVLMLCGFLDDKYNLKPTQQIIFPVLAALLIIYSGIKIQFVTNPLGGIIKVPVYLGTVIAFFWILGMIYTTKFLDGLDGLVTGVTAVGSLIIFLVSLYWDIPYSGTSILALILAGSCLGFLFFNWYPAKIFLGEGGSVFCGFILGTLAIISGSKIATALLIMGIPILDIIWVIIRRVWQGKSPATADRKHLNFRLLDIGLTHRQTVIFLYALTIIFGLVSVFLHTKGKIIALLVLTLVMFSLALSLITLYRKNQKL